MISYFKNFKAITIGFFITVLLFAGLLFLKIISLDSNKMIENLILLGLWWFMFSFTIHHFNFFKHNKTLLYKILILVTILAIAVLIDIYQEIPENPITFFLTTLLGTGIVYLLAPKFFNTYKVVIALIYVVLLSYYFYIRMNNEADIYIKEYKEQVVGMFLLSIPVLILLYLFEQWKWLKNLKAKKEKAELALLKSQINPHFFFNTLNNLYGLTVEKSDKAPEVVLKLSDMMRYSIYEGKKELVSLKNEIEYLNNYIELHKIRFQKKVDIKTNYEVDKDYEIAPLLFLILLENAFKHGIESMTDNAFINLNLTAKENNISFTIKNSFESKITNESSGIGLKNLQQRLELLYPEQHKLSIKKDDSTFDVNLEIKLK